MSRWRAWAGLLAFLFVQSTSAADPDSVLQQALAKLQSTLQILPRYACIETVDRQYFEPVHQAGAPTAACAPANSANGRISSKIPEATDRLRLEVTVSDGREIYSWPGATRFDPRDVGDMIRRGPIGTGSFGAYLLAVFGDPGVQFHFAGQETASGSTVFEYRFRVPRQGSRFGMRVGASSQPVAYEGAFWVDAQSFDLQRLRLWTQELPSETSVCELEAELDYGHPSADAAILLPSQSQLRLLSENGRQTNNITSFSACRLYRAESALRFEENPQVEDAPAPILRVPTSLPLGLPVTLALMAPIDTATAAAGDEVSARVVRAVRKPGTDLTLIPAGAVVLGRLTRVEHHLFPSPYFAVAISFNRLDWQGAFAPFAAHSEGSASLIRELGAKLPGSEGGFVYWNSGTFLFPTNKSHYIIPAGFESKWMTLAIRFR